LLPSVKVVATLLLCLTVHRCIAGDVSIYLYTLRSNWPNPSEIADFDRFHLIVP